MFELGEIKGPSMFINVVETTEVGGTRKKRLCQWDLTVKKNVCSNLTPWALNSGHVNIGSEYKLPYKLPS